LWGVTASLEDLDRVELAVVLGHLLAEVFVLALECFEFSA
jgi:hypothetical protein